jgi:hypothetical protein
MTLTHAQKVTVLEAYGFTIGARDARFKPQFPGKFMVLESGDEENVEDCWCVVGDDLPALVDEGFSLATDFSYFDAVCEDVLAGGVGLLHTDGKGAGPIIGGVGA